MTKSEIFKAAHAAARKTLKLVGDYRIAFQFAIKEIYMNMKNTETTLLELGAKIWERGSKKRIYINKSLLLSVFGLDLEFYNTGNISGAWINDERISNKKAFEYVRDRIYFDCNLNKFVGTTMAPII